MVGPTNSLVRTPTNSLGRITSKRWPIVLTSSSKRCGLGSYYFENIDHPSFELTFPLGGIFESLVRKVIVLCDRRHKNYISPLVMSNGKRTNSDKEVEEKVLSMFSNLHSHVVMPKPFIQVIDWCPIFPGMVRSW